MRKICNLLALLLMCTFTSVSAQKKYTVATSPTTTVDPTKQYVIKTTVSPTNKASQFLAHSVDKVFSSSYPFHLPYFTDQINDECIYTFKTIDGKLEGLQKFSLYNVANKMTIRSTNGGAVATTKVTSCVVLAPVQKCTELTGDDLVNVKKPNGHVLDKTGTEVNSDKAVVIYFKATYDYMLLSHHVPTKDNYVAQFCRPKDVNDKSTTDPTAKALEVAFQNNAWLIYEVTVEEGQKTAKDELKETLDAKFPYGVSKLKVGSEIGCVSQDFFDQLKTTYTSAQNALKNAETTNETFVALKEEVIAAANDFKLNVVPVQEGYYRLYNEARNRHLFYKEGSSSMPLFTESECAECDNLANLWEVKKSTKEGDFFVRSVIADKYWNNVEPTSGGNPLGLEADAKAVFTIQHSFFADYFNIVQGKDVVYGNGYDALVKKTIADMSLDKGYTHWRFEPIAGHKAELAKTLTSQFAGGMPAYEKLVGTNPGEPSQKGFEALKLAYNGVAALVQNDAELTDEAYQAALLDIEAMKAAYLSGVTPVTKGYYLLHNEHSGNEMYEANGGLFVGAVNNPLDAANTNSIWEVQMTDNGRFFLKNFETQNYIAHSSGSNLRVKTIAAKKDIYSATYAQNGYFFLKDIDDNMLYKSGGKGDNFIKTWNSTEVTNGHFKFIRVADEEVAALQAAAEQNRLSAALKNLVKTATADVNAVKLLSGLTYDGNYTDNAKGLISTFTGTNAEHGKGSIASAFDGDLNTFYYSAWLTSQAPANEFHYVSIDLGKDLQNLVFKFSGRGDLPKFDPTVIDITSEDGKEVLGTIDVKEKYDYSATYGGEEKAGMTAIAEVALTKPAQKIRFVVKETKTNAIVGGGPRWNVSEFRVYDAADCKEDPAYAAVPQEVKTALETALDAANKALAEKKVTAEVYDKLVAAVENFWAHYAKATPEQLAAKAELKKAYDAALTELVKNFGHDYGMYEGEAELQSALDAADEMLNITYVKLAQTSVEDIKAVTTALNEAVAAIELLLPTEDALFRIKTVNAGHAPVYVNADAATGLTLAGVKDNATFCIHNGHLVNYNGGFAVQVEGNNVKYEAATKSAEFALEKKETIHEGAFQFNLKSGESALQNVDGEKLAMAAADAKCNFTLEKVGVLPVTITAARFATFFAPVAVSIPSNVKAYVGHRDAAGEYFNLQEIQNVIPANTAVILEAVVEEGVKFEGDTYQFYFSGENVAALDNELAGDVEVAVNNKDYTLQMVGGIVGLYTYTGAILNGFKAYLPAATAAGVQGLKFNFGDLTGIDEVENNNDAQDQIFYDLNGRRVLYPAHGIFVTASGKKVFFK